MGNSGYPEEQLVANRTAVLLFGGTEAERRAWASEASSQFEEEGPLVEVAELAGLAAALSRTRGVVFVSDLASLGSEGQAKIVRCLIEREERPKLILGLAHGPDHARSKGLLREDLSYRLEKAQVDLSSAELKDAIRARRVRAEKKRPPPAARKSVPAGRKSGKG